MPSDVIIFWSHGGVPNDIRDRSASIFKYPIEFVQMPDPPVDGSGNPIWNKAIESLGDRPINKILKVRNVKASRVAVLGFSASCTPLRLVLDSADGGYIDTAIAIDGIHAGVDIWSEFASLAANGGAEQQDIQPGKRCCIITHSQVQPTYTSTTETAQQIVQNVFGGSVYEEDEEVPLSLTKHLGEPVTIGCSWHNKKYTYSQMPYWYQVNKGGLHVIGYQNLDPTGCTDHIFQAKVILPRTIEFLLAPRWHNPAPTGTCMVTV